MAARSLDSQNVSERRGSGVRSTVPIQDVMHMND